MTIIIVGYTTKYVPALAAKVGLISGVVLYSISQFVLKPYVFGEENYPHFLHVMAILFVLNTGIMLIIGEVSPRTEAYAPYESKAVELTPWKHLKFAGLSVVVIVLGIYFYFA